MRCGRQSSLVSLLLFARCGSGLHQRWVINSQPRGIRHFCGLSAIRKLGGHCGGVTGCRYLKLTSQRRTADRQSAGSAMAPKTDRTALLAKWLKRRQKPKVRDRSIQRNMQATGKIPVAHDDQEEPIQMVTRFGYCLVNGSDVGRRGSLSCA